MSEKKLLKCEACGSDIQDGTGSRIFNYNICHYCTTLAEVYFESFLKSRASRFNVPRVPRVTHNKNIKTSLRTTYIEKKEEIEKEESFELCGSCSLLFIDSKTKKISCADGIEPRDCDKNKRNIIQDDGKS